MFFAAGLPVKRRETAAPLPQSTVSRSDLHDAGGNKCSPPLPRSYYAHIKTQKQNLYRKAASAAVIFATPPGSTPHKAAPETEGNVKDLLAQIPFNRFSPLYIKTTFFAKRRHLQKKFSTCADGNSLYSHLGCIRFSHGKTKAPISNPFFFLTIEKNHIDCGKCAATVKRPTHAIVFLALANNEVICFLHAVA